MLLIISQTTALEDCDVVAAYQDDNNNTVVKDCHIRRGGAIEADTKQNIKDGKIDIKGNMADCSFTRDVIDNEDDDISGSSDNPATVLVPTEPCTRTGDNIDKPSKVEPLPDEVCFPCAPDEEVPGSATPGSDVTVVPPSKQSADYPPGCKDDDCKFKLDWKRKGRLIYYRFRCKIVRISRWVMLLIFSQTTALEDCDVVAAYQDDNNNTVVKDCHIRRGSEIEADTKQNIKDGKIDIKGDMADCSFTRDVIGNEDDDISGSADNPATVLVPTEPCTRTGDNIDKPSKVEPLPDRVCLPCALDEDSNTGKPPSGSEETSTPGASVATTESGVSSTTVVRYPKTASESDFDFKCTITIVKTIVRVRVVIRKIITKKRIMVIGFSKSTLQENVDVWYAKKNSENVNQFVDGHIDDSKSDCQNDSKQDIKGEEFSEDDTFINGTFVRNMTNDDVSDYQFTSKENVTVWTFPDAELKDDNSLSTKDKCIPVDSVCPTCQESSGDGSVSKLPIDTNGPKLPLDAKPPKSSDDTNLPKSSEDTNVPKSSGDSNGPIKGAKGPPSGGFNGQLAPAVVEPGSDESNEPAPPPGSNDAAAAVVADGSGVSGVPSGSPGSISTPPTDSSKTRKPKNPQSAWGAAVAGSVVFGVLLLIIFCVMCCY